MKKKNISEILSRIEELRLLFRFGQRTLPLMDNFFQFIQEILPLLEGINASIAEGTAKLPKASNELHNVTKATEVATFEILDTVEAMTTRLMETGQKMESVKTAAQRYRERNTRAAELIRGLGDSIDAAKKEELLSLITGEESAGDVDIDAMVQTLQDVQLQAQNITIALQVQDITAQQLAAVNHLVESVHLRLQHLLDCFEDAELEKIYQERQSVSDSTPKSFDPNATFLNTEERKRVAESLKTTLSVIESTNPEAKQEPPAMSTQEEVDKMFSK